MLDLGIWGNKSKNVFAIFAIRALKVESLMQCKKFQFKTETLFFRLTLKKIFTYLKSAFSTLSKSKISGKSRNSKFSTKNTSFGYVWDRI